MNKLKTKFIPVLEALTNYDQPFPPRLLRDFSDLSLTHLNELKSIWSEIKRERKISLLEDLETIAESDTLVNFDELAKMTINDEDPAVKVLSIRLLWECEETRLIPILTELMLSDPAEDVRAAAASALGKFVLLGELDSIPDSLRISSVQNLIDVTVGEDLPMVRRRALESLGFSSNPKVSELINWASTQEVIQWLTSAIYAMARSADDRWSNPVLDYLSSPDSEVKFEAVRAAGELGLEESRDTLLEMLNETVDDKELRFAIIWSLSQIGGENVKKTFDDLAEKCSDEEESEWLEKALENLEVGGQLESMDLLEYRDEEGNLSDSDDLEDFDDEDDLLEDDELDENDQED
ncbi:MAG: HEAT repeat domain-containing protein [Anaerolineaceae bacterium]